MEPQPNPSPRTIFGPFEFEANTGELRKNGVRLRLTGQPLQILVVLLERPNEVVGREELQQRLWNGTTFVDFEHGLNAAINKLRQTLGDSVDQPRWVETLPARGYRFIGALRYSHPEHVLEMTVSPPSEDSTEELQPAAEQVQPVSGSSLHLTRRQSSLALVGIAVLATAGFAAIRFVRKPLPNPTSPLVRFRIPIPTELTLAEAQGFSVSPDGRTMVYAAKGSDHSYRLWVQPLDSLLPRMLPGTEGAIGAIWSPDSKFVAFYADGKLKRTDLNGGPTSLIAQVSSTVLGGDCSRDGTIIFGTETPGVMRVDANGGEAVVVTTRDPARGDRVNGWPTFLPDGRHFLYFAFPGPLITWGSLLDQST